MQPINVTKRLVENTPHVQIKQGCKEVVGWFGKINKPYHVEHIVSVAQQNFGHSQHESNQDYSQKKVSLSVSFLSKNKKIRQKKCLYDA